MAKKSFADGVRKVLDNTVGAVGYGLGFGSAYAAEVPVLGAPVKALNEGIGRGYNRAQVRILASKIVDGKTSAEEEMAKLDVESRKHLADEVARVQAGLKPTETTTEHGEITERPGFGAEFLGGEPAKA